MDLTRVEWRGGMSCGGSSGGAGAGDPGSKWGSSSSTCSKVSRERSKGGSKVFVEVTRDSYGKSSKTEEVGREERKGESLTNNRCSQKITLRETLRQ